VSYWLHFFCPVRTEKALPYDERYFKEILSGVFAALNGSRRYLPGAK
jgi:hypothetical protein